MRSYNMNELPKYAKKARCRLLGQGHARQPITGDRPMPCAPYCKSSTRKREIVMELLSQPQRTYTGPPPGSREQVRAITAELRRLYPDARTSLNFTNPFELLIATQLSA